MAKPSITMSSMLLINWHKFENEIVPFNDGGVFLMGPNAAGKSTLMDALQLVITPKNRNKFNKSANEDSRRSIKTYCRWRTGVDGDEYNRTEDTVITYIAIEFTRKDHTKFLIGCAITTTTESEPKWFYLNDKTLSTTEFSLNGYPLTPNEFGKKNPGIEYYDTTEKASKAISGYLGNLDRNALSTLLHNGLESKKAKSVEDFLYNYILPAPSTGTEISSLKSDFANYQELQHLAQRCETFIQKLSEIEFSYNQYKKNCEETEKLTYWKKFLAYQKDKEKLKASDEKLKKITTTLQNIEKELGFLNEKYNQYTKEAISLQFSQENSDIYKTIQEYRTQLLAEEQYISGQALQIKTWENAINKEAAKITWLKSNAPKIINQNPRLLDYHDVLITLRESIAKQSFPEDLNTPAINDTVALLEKLKGKFNNIVVLKKQRIEEDKKESERLEESIITLSNQSRSYPANVITTKKAVEEILHEKNEGAYLTPLCELIDIKPEYNAWRAAIEAYLNTQRFLFYIQPNFYELASTAFKAVCKKDKALKNVGLINTREYRRPGQSPLENSIAAALNCKNEIVQNFINRRFGQTILCAETDSIETFQNAITADGRVYKNHTTIKHDIKICEREPFIGSMAVKIALKNKQAEKQKLDSEIIKQQNELAPIAEALQHLNNDNITLISTVLPEYKERVKRLVTKKALEEKINECSHSEDLMFIETKIQECNEAMQATKRELETKERERENTNRIIGETQSKNNELIESINTQKRELDTLEETFRDIVNTWKIDFENEGLLHKAVNLDEKINDLITQKNNKISNIQTLMGKYATEDTEISTSDANIEKIDVFLKRKELLESQELPSYSQQLKEDQKKCEIAFNNQIIINIQESITKAIDTIKSLNKELANHPFGDQVYRYYIDPAPGEKQEYYHLIMNSHIYIEKEDVEANLFAYPEDITDEELTTIEHEKTLLKKLHQLILTPDADVTEEARGLMDYRNYIKVDLKAIYPPKEGEVKERVISLSQNGSSRSGGETQIPFYLTLACSLYKIYNSRVQANINHIGLFWLDEAFSKVDASKIPEFLTYLREELNLQVVISAQDHFMYSIAPYVETTLICSINGNDPTTAPGEVISFSQKEILENYSPLYEEPVNE